VVDLYRAADHLDAGHRAQRCQLAARRIDRDGLQIVAEAVGRLVPLEHQVDLATFDLVVADLRAIDQRADGKTQLSVGHAEIGHAAPVRDDAKLRATEIETRDRPCLRAGNLGHDRAEHHLSGPHQRLQLRTAQIDIDPAPAAHPLLEDADLHGDAEASGDAHERLLQERNRLAHPAVVVTAQPHEDLIADPDVEEVAEPAALHRERLGRPGLDLPARPEVGLDGLRDHLQLIQVVPRRWNEDADDEIAVPRGEVLGLGHQREGSADGDHGETEDDDQPPGDSGVEP
jgi:hypothetical protein